MARSTWRRSRSPAASAWKPATRIFTGGRSIRSCATGSTSSPRARRSLRPRRHDLRGRPEMVFMVIEHFRPGQAPEVYRRFRERGRMAPEGLRYVASWVDMDFQALLPGDGDRGRGAFGAVDRELGRSGRLR